MTDKHRMTDEQLGKELESLISGNVESATPPAGTFLAIQDRLGEQDADWSPSRLIRKLVPGEWRLPLFTGMFVKVGAAVVVALAVAAILVFQGRDSDQENVVPADDPTPTPLVQIEPTATTVDQVDDEPIEPTATAEMIVVSPTEVPTTVVEPTPAVDPSPSDPLTQATAPSIPDPPTPTAAPDPEPPASDNWISAGSLNEPRDSHFAVTLIDGRVLVVGGDSDTTENTLTAEIFDPDSESWTLVTPSPYPIESSSVSTRLRDGRVMFVGSSNAEISSQAVIYDPVADEWSTVSSAIVPRVKPLIETLNDGRVLIAGGLDCPSGIGPGRGIRFLCAGEATEGYVELTSSEIYDPETDSWEIVGDLNWASTSHWSSAVLSDGRVIKVGGSPRATIAGVEVFDPSDGSWKVAPELPNARGGAVIVVDSQGRAFAFGGRSGSFSAKPELSTNVYDPESNTWDIAESIGGERCASNAFNLPDGRIATVWSQYFDACANFPLAYSVEIYDQESGVWTEFEAPEPLMNSNAVALTDGRIVVTGGKNLLGERSGTKTYIFTPPAK